MMIDESIYLEQYDKNGVELFETEQQLLMRVEMEK